MMKRVHVIFSGDPEWWEIVPKRNEDIRSKGSGTIVKYDFSMYLT